MGVMNCQRKNCENILCDTYVDGIGYICSDCQNEFKDYLKSKGLDLYDVISEGVLRTELKKFITSEKDDYLGSETTVYEFFKKHTKLE